MNREERQKRLANLDQKTRLSLNSKCNFNPFKGWTVQSVIKERPQFIRWLIARDIIELDNEAYSEYIYQLEAQTDRQSREG